jgi:hypothetical protein
MRLLFQLVGTLLLVAWVMHFLGWIIGIAGLAAAVWMGLRIYRASAEADAADPRRLQEIRARADQQQNWVMQGDERGVYGPGGAALMREIRR